MHISVFFGSPHPWIINFLYFPTYLTTNWDYICKGLNFSDKKTGRGLPAGLVPVSDPFPEGDLPEVELIVEDTSKFEDTTSSNPKPTQDDNSDLYKLKVSTWGVFPRPSNISKTVWYFLFLHFTWEIDASWFMLLILFLGLSYWLEGVGPVGGFGLILSYWLDEMNMTRVGNKIGLPKFPTTEAN